MGSTSFCSIFLHNWFENLKSGGWCTKNDLDLRAIFLHTDLQTQPIHLIPSLERSFVLCVDQKITRTVLEHPEINLLDWCFLFHTKLPILVSSSFSQERCAVFCPVCIWPRVNFGDLGQIFQSDGIFFDFVSRKSSKNRRKNVKTRVKSEKFPPAAVQNQQIILKFSFSTKKMPYLKNK